MFYKELYFSLFNAVTDAIEEMDGQNYGRAKALLIGGQQDAEEQYMEEIEEEMEFRESNGSNDTGYLSLLLDMSEDVRCMQRLLEQGKYAEAGAEAERILKEFDSREIGW